MGLRFRKSFKLFSGLKLNIGKKSISTSFGGKGFSINTGTNGTFINSGLSGTGISYRSKLFNKGRRTHNQANSQTTNSAIILGFIIGASIFLWSGSFLLSFIPVVIISFILSFKKNIQKGIIVKENENFITKSSHTLEESETLIISVEERIKSLYPNKYGLYPHEILALYMFPTYQMNNLSFPNYWWYEYGVKDVYNLLMSLKDRGFIKVKDTPTIKEILQNTKMDELRSIAKMYNLKTSRKKEQLIQIILDNIHCTELKNLIDIPQTTGIYVISEKGKQAICDDEYVLYAHRYKFDEFTVYSLNQLMKGDTKNYRKYIWRIFLQKEKQFIENHNYGLHSNLKLHMADFLSEEGQYLEALKMIADVIYIELSNLYNNAGVYPGSNSEYFIYDNTYYISDDPVSSGILGKLYEYQEKLKLDNEQLACILREQFNSLHLPFHVFTKEECINITLCLLNEQNEEIKNIYQTAIDRLKTKYPEIIFKQ